MSEGYLGAAFQSARTQLELTLDDQPATEQATHAIRAALNRLARDAETHPELGASERRQTAAAVELVRAAVVGTLAAVRAPALPQPRPSPPRRSPFHALLTGFGSEEEDRRREREREEELLRGRRPVAHTVSLLEQLHAALESADRLLAEAEPPPPEKVPIAWHEDGELVNLLRDLMAAHSENDGELALRRIARLRQELSLRHDIDVVDFDGTNEGLFTLDRQPGGGPAAGDCRTVQPALVLKGGRTLCRGEATLSVAAPPAPSVQAGTDVPQTRPGIPQAGTDVPQPEGDVPHAGVSGVGVPHTTGSGAPQPAPPPSAPHAQTTDEKAPAADHDSKNNGGKEHHDG
ncbi:hypothetical protein [Streptomyces chrestomyceticus]|uniref:Uncharacterized protein n=1 Tax=Streptomyces chrestomyceticus TaxID=68185 RepID=A0ABU7WRC6_9ACTN